MSDNLRDALEDMCVKADRREAMRRDEGVRPVPARVGVDVLRSLLAAQPVEPAPVDAEERKALEERWPVDPAKVIGVDDLNQMSWGSIVKTAGGPRWFLVRVFDGERDAVWYSYDCKAHGRAQEAQSSDLVNPCAVLSAGYPWAAAAPVASRERVAEMLPLVKSLVADERKGTAIRIREAAFDEAVDGQVSVLAVMRMCDEERNR